MPVGFKYSVVCFFLCFMFFAKAQTSMLEVFKYNIDPHMFEDTTGLMPIPVSKQEIEVYELTPFVKDRNNIVFYDSLNSTSVAIDATNFEAQKHTYNADKYWIDNKVFYGCDCMPDSTYSNFRQLRLLAMAGGKNVLRSENLPAILNPILTNQHGQPASKIYYLKKQKLYMLVLHGGDSAGAYTLFMFFDKTEVKAIYHQDINTSNVNLSADPKVKDLFGGNSSSFYRFRVE